VGLPLDWSENVTTSGAHPSVGAALKLAEGCAKLCKLVTIKKMATQLVFTNLVKDIGLDFCFYEWQRFTPLRTINLLLAEILC
jgi:hypothetical protein